MSAEHEHLSARTRHSANPGFLCKQYRHVRTRPPACPGLLHQQHRYEADLQPIHVSAAGGRGSSSTPPVGPVADHAVDNSYEAASAFYRNATFTRDTDSAASPLILTELPLDPFDGDTRQYPAFRNRFLDIVESHPDLPPRHKLLYLLQYLRGEPYRFASRLQLTDANYFVVVNQLEERYGNEDMLRNLLLGELVNLRPPSDEMADLYRFHDEAFRVVSELKQLGDAVDANRIYEQTLMGRLSEELRLKLIQIYGYGREKSVSAILDALRRYAKDLQMAKSSGIVFHRPAAPSAEAPWQEQRRSPPARSPSESSSEESSEYSEDASVVQPTAHGARATVTSVAKQTEERRMCQFCGNPHAAESCIVCITINQRLRRSHNLSLCLLCLKEGHRFASCPRRGTDFCSQCGSGTHHRALCKAVANGAQSGTLRRKSKCATCGSNADRKRSAKKRYRRPTLEKRAVNREATAVVATATKTRHSGTRRSPTPAEDNPNQRHAPVKAVHRSDSSNAKSTAQNVPPSAPRQDREHKPRASPARKDKPRAPPRTQGSSRNGTNSTKTYRKKEPGNAGTSSRERERTTRPPTASTDESKQKDAKAYGIASTLAERPDLLQTEKCSTNCGPPWFNRATVDPYSLTFSQIRELEAAGMLDELWDEDESYPESSGHGPSDRPTTPSDAYSDDYERFPAYKEVRAYVASASTTDAHAPLLECIKVTAVNPTTGATRKVIVFFDGGSDFSYLSPTLARDLDLPLHGKCVLRVNTFWAPAPLTAEGFSTSVVLCSPQGRQVSLGATTSNFAIPSVRTALVEDADLPSLRRNEREVAASQVTPGILIG